MLNDRKTTRHHVSTGKQVFTSNQNVQQAWRTIRIKSLQRFNSKRKNVPNLWKTFKYYNNDKHICFESADGFGGYPDWIYSEFNAIVSIRNDHANDYRPFEIGTYVQ